MPHSPSIPKITQTKKSPSPRAHALALEDVRERERIQSNKRRGYKSTMLTRGMLSPANIQKTKLLGL
jgi:hypothetical protein